MGACLIVEKGFGNNLARITKTSIGVIEKIEKHLIFVLV